MVKKLQAEEENERSERPPMSPMTKQITSKGPAVVGNLAYTSDGSVVRRLAYDAKTDDLMENVLQGMRSKDVQQAGVSLVASALTERLAGPTDEGEVDLALKSEEKEVSALASRALKTVLSKHLASVFSRPRGLLFLGSLGIIVARVGCMGILRGLTSAACLTISKVCSWLGSVFRSASDTVALQKPSSA